MTAYAATVVNGTWPLLVLIGSAGFGLVLSAFAHWHDKWTQEDNRPQ